MLMQAISMPVKINAAFSILTTVPSGYQKCIFGDVLLKITALRLRNCTRVRARWCKDVCFSVVCRATRMRLQESRKVLFRSAASVSPVNIFTYIIYIHIFIEDMNLRCWQKSCQTQRKLHHRPTVRNEHPDWHSPARSLTHITNLRVRPLPFLYEKEKIYVFC